MSKRNKLQKFADILSYPNVFENFTPKDPKLVGENGTSIDLKGKWNEIHFKNDHPITLELACGGGEYTLELAAMYPNRNFIGVDVKGARIWKGSTKALQRNLTNAAFLRTRIELIEHFFETDEVQEIWITFPDPFLRKSKANRRLTSPRFLEEYRKIMPKGSIINLKTDSPELYEYTLEALAEYPHAEIIYQDNDIYSKPLPIPELEFKTHYEYMHLEDKRLIKYVKIRLD